MIQHPFRLFLALSCLSGLVSGCATLGGAETSKQEDASQWVALAEASLGDKDPVGALQALQKAEQMDAKLPSLHHVRALAFLERLDLPAALSSARRAHELDRADSGIATTLGKILMDLNRTSEAEQVLLPAARDPLYRGAYCARTNLGILKFRTGELPAARFHLDRAIQDSPEMACVAYFYRSRVAEKQGRLKEAIRDLERSTQRLCTGYGEAEVALGSALIQDRQYDRARKKFLEIRQRFPGTEWAEAALDRLKEVP